MACGNALGLPVVAYFSVIPNYPNANLRHYHFLQQGLHDVAEGVTERGVGFVVRRPSDGDTLEKFLDEVSAAMVVGDENVCREPERWRVALAKRSCGAFLYGGCGWHGGAFGDLREELCFAGIIFDRTCISSWRSFWCQLRRSRFNMSGRERWIVIH